MDASRIKSNVVNRFVLVLNIAWQHSSLLNHMTIITKVRVSYVDHMNDDAPEVNSFSYECAQALSKYTYLGLRSVHTK